MPDSTKYACPKCPQQFETLYDYHRHIRESHPETVRPLAGDRGNR